MRVSYNVLLIILICITYIEINAGTITGRVRDYKDGSAIPGADVIITGTKYGSNADLQGIYKIENIPAGSYEIKAGAIGFKSDVKTIIISNSGTIKIDFLLNEEALNLSEVIIHARANRELETAARQSEKDAGNVVNVISAQAIQQSTDRTAADVLQRVSGISLIRDNNGEGQYVVMRGLDQRYNNTLIDGIKIPSPESKDRFVPLDIFPSGLFERIEVIKSLTPETAGDAIGGSSNLLLREAPDRLTFQFGASTGTSSGLVGNSFNSFNKNRVDNLDPERMHGVVNADDPTTQIKQRYNPSPSDFTTGNLKFTSRTAPPDGLFSGVAGSRFFDGKLGFMAAGSFQNTYDMSKTDFYSVGSNINKVDAAGHLIPYASTFDNQAYYINKIRSGLLVKADYIAGEEHELTAMFLNVRQEEDQTRHALKIEIDGARGANDLTYTNRSAIRTQNISSVSLGSNNFNTSPVQLHWTFNFTNAVQDRPDEAEYSVLQNYDIHGNLQPFQGLGNITHSWRKNDDKQYLGKLDAFFHIASDETQTLQAGIVTQKLTRANYEDDYQLNPAIINGSTQPFTSIDSAKVTVFGYGTTSGTSVYGYQNYKANEILLSSYLQYTAIIGQLQVLGGLRWEQASDEYYTMAAASVSDRQAKVKMVNFLPGIHFRYEFTPEQIGRLSITRTMSRPSYFDLVPAVDRSDESQSQGNPNLRPATSTNVDLRYEYYPNPADVYSLGFFYKKIQDPIEDQFQSVGVVLVTSKTNGNPATVYGIEAVLSKHFGVIGISTNYSYVYSRITGTKQVTTENINGDLIQSYYRQSRPLEAQSPQVANLIISYENPLWGTETNISYNYTGRRLIAVASQDGYDTYEDGTSEFDFSADQKLFNNFLLNIKIINLFNTPVVTEVASGNYVKHDPIVILRNFNKTRAAIGISYKF